MENPADVALDMINDEIITDKPEIGAENNGIGAYEFWGVNEFDHGQDVPYINEENRTVKISRKGFSDADISEIVFELIGKKHSVTILYETEFDYVPTELSYKIHGFFLAETTFDFFIVWDEIIG